MKTPIYAAAAAAIALTGTPALAHHSFAMFDLAKEMTIQGEVKDFQWTNPHVWLQVMVPDASGTPKEWGIEAGAPGMLLRTGWKSSTLKPGDKVTVVIHPLKSGKTNGSMVRTILPDGRTLGPGGAPPPLPIKPS